MRSVLKDNSDDREERRWVRGTLLTALVVGLLVCAVLIVHSFLAKPTVQKRNVQNVAILKQPPPPPPKPPEKPPEPPKIKDEVKIPEPKVEPKPDEPKPADDKPPPADKPLGVDAEAGAGSDGFGLVGNKGGREITTLGGGGGGLGGAYYSGLLQRQFFEALSRNRKVLRDEFRVVVKIWVGDDGRVQKAEVVSGSGNVQVDEQIQVTLMDMAPLRDVPPNSMRPIQLRLSNRS